jgi:L-methionine (R)-S-oxide reductase
MISLSENLIESCVSIVEGEPNVVANLANVSSLIFHTKKDLNWAGFYLWDESKKNLVLGPFQGKPACIRIPPDKGVCGKAYSTQQTILVDDVHLFAGHIACDSNSRSELVVPLIRNSICLGVLDLDSPLIKRFTASDAQLFEVLVKRIVPLIWP